MQRSIFTWATIMVLSISVLAQNKNMKVTPRLGKNTLKEVIAAMTLEEKAGLVVGMGMRMPDGTILDPELVFPDPNKPASEKKVVPAAGPVVGVTEDKVPGAAGTTFAIPRLGIPSIVLADGPAGLRITPIRKNDASQTYYCTAFPVATLLASTWDPALVKKVGEAMGNEVHEYGVDVLLAPALNIHRNPLGGRNFEYYSEDPLISGKMAAAMVNGIQSNGVGTSIKHFAANNHETNRNTIDVEASPRALREIYLRGFEISVKESSPWTVMSSYNKLNGIYTSENSELLTSVLRDEWKYKGFVMTDWFGGKDPIAQMKAGNDMIMPGAPKQSAMIVEAVKNGSLAINLLDRNVENILQIILKTPSFKGYKFSNKPNLAANAQVARSVAAEGMVLLKNEMNALPIAKSVKKIAAFGNTTYDIIAGGTGSGDVNKAYSISLIEGLKNAGYSLDESLAASYSQFIKESKESRPKLKNWFALPVPIAEFNVGGDVIEKMADNYDIAIITIGRNSGEFNDRKPEADFNLTETEKGLISSVSKAFHAKGKKAVVILNVGGVIEVQSWRDEVDGILLAWQPGQETGNAIADILSGKVNPSGKIASTFPVKYEDVPSAKNFPGTPIDNPTEILYEEGIYVGYRYYDTFGVKTAYEFGYGLSYTNFTYSDLKLSSKAFNNKITATIDITNSGTVAGKEVVQLYISAPSGNLQKPEKELKAFVKTTLLEPGKKQTVSFEINSRDLASYDSKSFSWVANAGKYAVKVGASSQKIKSTANFDLAKNIIVEKESNILNPSKEVKEIIK